jgi:predicted O-methyltransferase YrrM
MFKMLGRLAVSVGVAIGISCPALALAGDPVNVKQMSVDVAEELVRAAVTACRAQGWQATA